MFSSLPCFSTFYKPIPTCGCFTEFFGPSSCKDGMINWNICKMCDTLFVPFCVHRLKKKQRAKLKKEQQQAQSSDNSKQEGHDSKESGGDSDDAYENPFVIGGR